MRFRLPLWAVVGAALLAAAPAGASAAEFVPGEVIVGYEDASSPRDRADVRQDAGAGRPRGLPGGADQLEILDGESVRETISELQEDPDVEYAVPNFVMRVSDIYPNDPGFGDPGDWQKAQWNFAGQFGVDAPEAWEASLNRDAPYGLAPGAGRLGEGVTVAVLDSGVAYVGLGGCLRAPDLNGARWVTGYDFVEDDRRACDENDDDDRATNHGRGHGTHVAATIVEQTNNGQAVTGLAPKVRLMPVRVVDVNGDGNTADLARGVSHAAKYGADVINMSIEFDRDLTRSDIPHVVEATRYAHDQDAAMVAAAGNGYRNEVAYPARLRHVISVGATTVTGCRARYSNQGTGLDLVAPGGGLNAAPGGADVANCPPIDPGRLRWIYQQTFKCSLQDSRPCDRFGLPARYEGTSMASPHAAATAALLIATAPGRFQSNPFAIERRLERTATDLGAEGYDTRYGYGLLDAGDALGG